jgi:hypothetical protein
LAVAVVLATVASHAMIASSAWADAFDTPKVDGVQNDDEAFSTYLDWASADYRLRDWIGFSIGSWPNASSFSEPAIPSINWQGTPSMDNNPYLGWRGPLIGMKGIGFFGNLPQQEISYELQYKAPDQGLDDAFFRAIENELAVDIANSDIDHSYGGSLFWNTPFKGLQIGGSLYRMRMTADFTALDRMPTDTTNSSLPSVGSGTFTGASAWSASAQQQFGKLRLKAEYIQNRLEFENEASESFERVGEGYIGSAFYRLADRLEIGTSYSIYFADRTDRKGDSLLALGKDPAQGYIKDIGVSARFDISPNWMFQIEGHMMNGLLGAIEGTEEEWSRFGARMTIKF